MAVAASQIMKALPILPNRVEMLVREESWRDYEQFLEDLGPKPSVRVFYDQGRMWIVPPLPDHKRPKVVVNRLVGALSEELQLPVISFGSSTLKLEKNAKGAEPDDSFYIRNVGQLLNKTQIDLTADPPPDIVVEVDNTNASLDKFPIYAGLNVPEIWRIEGAKVQIFVLAEAGYAESAFSSVLPGLTAQALSTFLEQGLKQGEWVAAPAFREWLRQNYRKNS